MRVIKSLPWRTDERLWNVYNKEKSGISLVILDLIVPKLGGKRCLEELLKIHPGLKVLIASGYSDAKSRDDLLQAGAKGFVAKPFQMSQLLKTVRTGFG